MGRNMGKQDIRWLIISSIFTCEDEENSCKSKHQHPNDV